VQRRAGALELDHGGFAMSQQIFTFAEAAKALHIGRNTLTKRLRTEARMLDAHNLPAGKYRGSPYLRVEKKHYRHPDKGRVPYSRTVITARGLRHIARRLELPLDSANPTQH